MKVIPLHKKEKTLGKVYGKRRYDLPLNNNANSRFLVILIGLMSFLATLGLSAFFTLGAMSQRWISGLENNLTLEIPAETSEGRLLSLDEMNNLTQAAASILTSYPDVARYNVMDREEIQNLVEPWLGKGALSADSFPLPGLISIKVKDQASRQSVESLAKKIEDTIPGARLDTHESWLKDVLRFTNALRFSTTVLLTVIAVTTVIAVAGAVNASLSAHHTDVELLHLMGAADSYISRQFQRHALLLGLAGSAAGAMIGLLGVTAIDWLAGEMEIYTSPQQYTSLPQTIGTAMVPAVIALLAMATARQTVLHELAKMP
ncbi:MAG: permease [Micavibrio aeruginosavorus]|uniref:Permease n=1 Tax=Micavibrio aeruginosavorus TaxID=349221 RepID=A0A7T5R159_9BACT|nr:MAG: permease [Micavibrio aeruginosavorus]